ncbi:MAG: hypothetical protein ABSC53_12170 [Bacteroidota bacterium]
MGAIYNTIFRISPDDNRNLYVFTYGVQKWDDIYQWIEEKFFQVSTALGIEGLFVIGEDGSLDNELKEVYGKINDTIKSVTEVGRRGFVVTNANPHKIQNIVSGKQPQVLFIPIKNSSDRDELAKLVDNIVRAAKENDISLLKPFSISIDTEKNQSILTLVISNLLVQPNFGGFGFDIGSFWKQLKKRKEK